MKPAQNFTRADSRDPAPPSRHATGAPRAASPNADLVGRVFSDGVAQVRVTGLSATNPAHVVVEREHDGHSWTIHAGVVRLCLARRHRRAA